MTQDRGNNIKESTEYTQYREGKNLDREFNGRKGLKSKKVNQGMVDSLDKYTKKPDATKELRKKLAMHKTFTSFEAEAKSVARLAANRKQATKKRMMGIDEWGAE